MGEDFKIHTLGCGSAKPTPRHQPSSTVVEHHGTLYMIDCGEGAQQMFSKMRLKTSRLAHIFLTHLHGDHVFGIFGLIGTLALLNKGGHITIHTFQEGKEILEKIFDYFCRETPFEIRYNILDHRKSEIALDTGKLRVRTIPLRHRIPCVGYLFEEAIKPRHINRAMCDFHHVPVARMKDIRDGKDFVKENGTIIANSLLTTSPSPSFSYAHLGDTAYFPELAKEVGPVDLMFHETTYLRCDESLAAPRGHSTAMQAAQCAADANAKWLLTGHYSSRYKDDKPFLTEAEQIFPNVILNREGLTTDLRKLSVL